MGSSDPRMNTLDAAKAASDAASGAAKIAGVGSLATVAHFLEASAPVWASMSAIVAILGGVIYSIKMVIEMYWINRIKRQEAARLEKEQA